MSRDVHDLLIAVAAAIVYAVLDPLVRVSWRYLTSHNPVWEKARIGATLLLAFLIAVLAVSVAGANLAVTSIAFAFVIGIILLYELQGFWRVGLMGVDKQLQSGIDHVRALELCKSSLKFMGIGASKLTGKREAFEAAIDRCDNLKKPICFLLSRPDTDELERIARMANRDRTDYQRTVQESLRVIAWLKTDRKKNIEVRFYKSIPAFRLMFLNHNICLASHYVLGKGAGSDLPQLQILRKAEADDKSSLYFGFEYYFNSMWETAENWDFKEYL